MEPATEKATREAIQEKQVAYIHDKMKNEYDTIVDPWFSHLYNELTPIVEEVGKLSGSSNPLALDVGSGTGIQTLMFKEEGYSAIGIDISRGLTRVALAKDRKIGGSGSAGFCISTALNIPFESEKFDLVNCCGSTLSFILNYSDALKEICRVLKPGGRLLLEVENKWNLDAFWVLLSSVFRDFLRYENSFQEALQLFRVPFNQGLTVKWPFTYLDGSVEEMNLRLFTFDEIEKSLDKFGIKIDATIGLHIFTNLVPSTVLSDPSSQRWISTMRRFAHLDNRFRRISPFNKFGASLVVIGRKF